MNWLCPVHNTPARTIPAGISKLGKKYLLAYNRTSGKVPDLYLTISDDLLNWKRQGKVTGTTGVGIIVPAHDRDEVFNAVISAAEYPAGETGVPATQFLRGFFQYQYAHSQFLSCPPF